MRAGRALELEVQELLRRGGFQPHDNPSMARPRQTDLAAQGQGLHLLIEVKDRKRAVEVGDIDSLRVRLARTAPDFIGVIFTTGSITKGAIKAIETDRTREVLVLVGTELELLRADQARLFNLISKKRSELRLNGRAWFRSGPAGDYLGVDLPKQTLEYVYASKAGSYFCSRTDFAHAAFSLDIPDTGRGEFEGVRLHLDLSLSTLAELQDLFGYLHASFGLSSNGAFTIHQSDACWHGSGVRNFIAAVGNFARRYSAAALTGVHHSEDLIFFDQFRDGWLSFNARQRVPDPFETSGRSYIFDADVCIQLPGVPVDATAFIDLCRYTGNEWAQFKVVPYRLMQTIRLRSPMELTTVGQVVQIYDQRDRERWVIGLIARNPWYRKKRLPRELQSEESSLQGLLGMELLLCDLKHHIEDGDRVDKFVLKGIQSTDTDDAQIIRPFASWHKIVERVTPPPPSRAPMAQGSTLSTKSRR